MPKLHGSDWFSGWRIQTRSVDHCPFPRASVNVTCWHAWHKVCEQGSKGKWKLAMDANTIRGTVTDMGKGQNPDTHGFPLGNRQPHEETHTQWGANSRKGLRVLCSPPKPARIKHKETVIPKAPQIVKSICNHAAKRVPSWCLCSVCTYSQLVMCTHLMQNVPPLSLFSKTVQSTKFSVISHVPLKWHYACLQEAHL